jgi:hypothetical protein
MKMRWIAGAALLLLAVGACERSATETGARAPARGAVSHDIYDDLGNIPEGQEDTISGGGGYFGSGLNRPPEDTIARN